MSHRRRRLAGSRAVVCGVRLRQLARSLAALCLLPMPKSSLQRWLETMGAHGPGPEERRRPLGALPPAPECPRDGDAPRGPDPWGMVVKEAPERSLMPQEAAAEHGDEARQGLQRCQACGRKGTAAVSDDAQSCPEALPAVEPQARGPADHGHTVQHRWGPLNQARFFSRRPSKARGATKHEQDGVARAKLWWQWRGSLRKQPTQGAAEAKQGMAALARAEEGVGPSCRSRLRQLGHLVDHAPSAAQAQRRLPQLSQDSRAVDDEPLETRLPCFDDHGEPAWRYLRTKGRGQHRRGSNAESGRRRRLAKNHDGIRSAATRQHDMQSSQALKDLSRDMAEFIEQGPQMTGPLRV
jgi:hypothetical protein